MRHNVYTGVLGVCIALVFQVLLVCSTCRDWSSLHTVPIAWCCSTGQRRKIVKKHGLVYEDRHDGLRRLKLVRGLSNMFGQYNCFLNVIIQSLWHLPAFRRALLTFPTTLPESNGASAKDAAVVRALQNVFAAFAKGPSPDAEAAIIREAAAQSPPFSSEAAQQQQPQQEGQSARADSEAQQAARQSVSPDELREALSELEKGQSPIEFELSEMHDASEVSIGFVNMLSVDYCKRGAVCRSCTADFSPSCIVALYIASTSELLRYNGYRLLSLLSQLYMLPPRCALLAAFDMVVCAKSMLY